MKKIFYLFCLVASISVNAATINIQFIHDEIVSCKENEVTIHFRFDAPYTTPNGNHLFIGLKSDSTINVGEVFQSVSMVKIGDWKLFDLGSSSFANNAIFDSVVNLFVNCSAISNDTTVKTYKDSLALFDGAILANRLPSALWEATSFTTPQAVSEFVYNFYFAAFGAAASNTDTVKINYIDVFRSLNGGAPLTRTLKFINSGPSPSGINPFFIEGKFNFRDSIKCTFVKFRNVTVSFTGYSSTTSINNNTFSLGNIPYQINFTDTIVITEELEYPNYDSTCIEACLSAERQFFSSFTWGCSDHYYSGYVTDNLCQNNTSTVPLNRGSKRPNLIISRLLPLPVAGSGTPTAFWDTNLSTNTWKYRIKNTGLDAAKNLSIELSEYRFALSSFYYLKDSAQLHFTYLPSTSQIVDTFFSPYPHRDSTNLQPFCVRNFYPNSLIGVAYAIDQLLPGDSIEYEFPLEYCHPFRDTSIVAGSFTEFDQEKALNSFATFAFYTSECNESPFRTVSHSDISNGEFGIESPSNLSINGGGKKQLYLQQNFSPQVTDLDMVDSCSSEVPMEISNFQFTRDEFNNLYLRSASFFSPTYDVNAQNMFLQGKIMFRIETEAGLSVPDSVQDFEFSSLTQTWPLQPSNIIISRDSCLTGGSYLITYDFADFPTGNDLLSIYTFLNSSTFHFKFKGCCCGVSTNPAYSIKTFISGIDPLPVPMYIRKGHMNLHCAGCNMPGMTVAGPGTILLNRTNLGFKDSDNNGLADAPLAVLDSSYIANNSVRLNQSIVGDRLVSSTHAFLDNNAIPLNLQYINTNYGIQLHHLYFEQVIPYSNSNQFDVNIDTVTIRVRKGAMDWSHVFLPTDPNYSLVVYDKRNTIDISNGSVLDLYFYDLSDSILAILMNVPTFSFTGGEQFDVTTSLKVCGNYIKPGATTAPSDNQFTSYVNLFMYLTGSNLISQNMFNAYSGQHRPTAQFVYDATTNDTLSNDWLYVCETRAGNHYFYTVLPTVTSGLVDQPSSSCLKQLYIDHTITIGGQLSNVFPFEFRSAPQISSIGVNMPGGMANYQFGPLDTISSYSSLRTYYDAGCNFTNYHGTSLLLNYPMPANGVISLPTFPGSDSLSAFYDTTVCNSNFTRKSTRLFSSDEYLHQHLVFPFTWNDCGDSVVQVCDSDFIFTTLQAGNCSGAVTYTSRADITRDATIEPNAAQLTSDYIGQIHANQPSVCWTLTMRDPIAHILDNAFIVIPVPNSNFISTLTVNGVAATLDTLSPSQYAWIFPLGNLVAPLSQNFNICANLIHCSDTARHIPIYYGWNCLGVPTPSQILSGNVCDIDTNSVEIVFDGISQNSTFPSSYTYHVCATDTINYLLHCSQSSLDSVSFSFTMNDPTIQYVGAYFTFYLSATDSIYLTPDTIIQIGNTYTYIFDDLQGIYPGFLATGQNILMSAIFHPLNAPVVDPITLSYNFKRYCGDLPTPPSAENLSTYTLDMSNCSGPVVSVSQSELICRGDSIQLSCTPSGNYTYSWTSIPAGFTSSIRNPRVAPQIATVYNVQVTDSTGQSSNATTNIQVIQSVSCCIPTGFTLTRDTIYSNISSSQLGYDTVSTSLTQIIIIDSVFTIDQDFTFTSCENIVMQPNAIIHVLPGRRLSIDDSHIYSCSFLSRGIIADSNSYVSVWSSTIEDAIYGIEALKNSRVRAKNTTFKNDYTGIYFSSRNATGQVSFTSEISGCRFESDRTLNHAYLSAIPLPYIAMKAGVLVENTSFVSIGSGNSAQNVFQNINNGIVALNSNITVSRCRFLHLQRYDQFISEGGIGIYAEGLIGNTTCLLNQQGLNRAALPDFEDCQFGIYTKAVAIKSRENIMSNCDIGYKITFTRNQVSNVYKNTLDCNRYGVQLLFNDGSSLLSVANNIIDVGSRLLRVDGLISRAVGIIGTEFNTVNIRKFIKDNEIRMHLNSIGGVLLNGCHNVFVDHNYITMNNLINNSSFGIRLMNSIGDTISCNSVAGTDTTQNNDYPEAAMRFDGSRSGFISCNAITNTAHGLMFTDNCFGQSGSETVIRTNDIGNHYFGLYYTRSGRVDAQEFKGNLWYGANYGGSGALNLNSYNAQFYPYFVDVNGSTIPNTFNHHPQSSPSFWINGQIGVDQDCDWQTHHGQCGTSSTGGGGAGNYSKLIREALDSLFTSEFNEESRWQARVALYEKLLEMPVLKDTNEILNDFYLGYAGDALRYIAELNKDKKRIYQNQSLLMQQMENNAFSINDKTNQLAAIDSIIELKEWGIFSYDSIMSGRNTILNELNQLIEFNNLAADAIDSTREFKIDLMSVSNENISSSEIYEVNDKLVNTAFLATEGFKNPKELINYSQSLYDIAIQCPLAGGPAVYRARALYQYIDPEMEYDDENSCLQAGYVLRTSKGKSGSSRAFPNPAGNEINVIFDNGATEIVIKGITGNILIQKKLSENSNIIKLNTSNLPNGIYFYELLGVEKCRIDEGKFIISK